MVLRSSKWKSLIYYNIKHGCFVYPIWEAHIWVHFSYQPPIVPSKPYIYIPQCRTRRNGMVHENFIENWDVRRSLHRTLKSYLEEGQEWVRSLREKGSMSIASGYRVDENCLPRGGGLMSFPFVHVIPSLYYIDSAVLRLTPTEDTVIHSRTYLIWSASSSSSSLLDVSVSPIGVSSSPSLMKECYTNTHWNCRSCSRLWISKKTCSFHFELGALECNFPSSLASYNRDVQSVSNLLQQVLYGRRGFPYYAFCVVADVDNHHVLDQSRRGMQRYWARAVATDSRSFILLIFEKEDRWWRKIATNIEYNTQNANWDIMSIPTGNQRYRVDVAVCALLWKQRWIVHGRRRFTMLQRGFKFKMSLIEKYLLGMSW